MEGDELRGLLGAAATASRSPTPVALPPMTS